MTADTDHARALEVLRQLDGNLTLDEARALVALYVASVEVESADMAVAGELNSAGFGSSEYTERVRAAKARRRAAHIAWIAALAAVPKAVLP